MIRLLTALLCKSSIDAAEEYDFSGKQIIPYGSHGDGRFGRNLKAIDMGQAPALSYSGGNF